MRKPLRQAEAERLAAVPDLGEDVFRHGVLAPNGKPILDLPQVIQKLTASHQAWDGAPGHPIPHAGLGTVTYAFFNSSAEVYSSEKTQFQPLSEAQRIAVRDAFAIWGEIAGITFVEGTVAAAPPVAPPPGKSSGRHPDGYDTNDNSADFTVVDAPSPGGPN